MSTAQDAPPSARAAVIAPSILTADFGRLRAEVQAAEEGGAGRFHLDVMDGHFVPQLSFGPAVVDAVQRSTALPIEVHMMVAHPQPHFASFADVGAETLIFHLEATAEPEALIEDVRDLGCLPGLAISPATAVERALPLLPTLTQVTVMLVHPGRGGQQMLVEHLEKVRLLRAAADRGGFSIAIEVDGGVKAGNAPQCVAAGADILVAGSEVYNADRSPQAALARLLRALDRPPPPA